MHSQQNNLISQNDPPPRLRSQIFLLQTNLLEPIYMSSDGLIYTGDCVGKLKKHGLICTLDAQIDYRKISKKNFLSL
jgi:hypothetical protein